MLLPPRSTRLLLIVCLLLLGGCAKRIPDAEPSDIPQLEGDLSADPSDVRTATRLGIAYYKADRFADSRDVLAQVTETDESTGAAWLYLGLSNEGLEEWTEARSSYQRYLETGRAGPLVEEIRSRLQLIVRQELQAAARAAIEAENELATAEPAPRSIGVLPFRLIGDRPELEPLTLALADMMITDLSVTNALTVLERTRIQALLDEIALTEAGLADEATGARAGRLLQAEHIVQGALTTTGTDGIRLDGNVLNTVRRAAAGEISDEEQLEAIFDLEKTAVFQILDVLGVELTPAERQAIDENRSDNLFAFLAYGEGLQALDRGDYDAANAAFGQAVELDPGFSAAQTQNVESAELQSASQTSTDQIAAQATTELTGGPVGAPPESAVATGVGSTLTNVTQGVNPNPTGGQIDLGSTTGDGSSGTQVGNDRQPVQESGGNEGRPEPATARVRITIPRPGGGQ